MLASSQQLNDLVNQLRDDVGAWREAGYRGTALVTRLSSLGVRSPVLLCVADNATRGKIGLRLGEEVPPAS